ncbi:MAG: VOC family protein [Geodermatophilaceae bacterium]|nr:VOC family protein [Geodermatophilaceae bacterium]
MMQVIPRLVISGADAAIDFYQRAFAAKVMSRYTGPDGSVVNADLRIGESLLTLKDADDVDRSATSYGGSPVLLMLVVADADAVAAAMIAAGARVIFSVSDQSYGYRQGRLADPFGYQWLLSQDIEELTPEQTQDRLDSQRSTGCGRLSTDRIAVVRRTQ